MRVICEPPLSSMSIGAVRERGYPKLVFTCVSDRRGPPWNDGRCHHTAWMEIEDAIATWGEDRTVGSLHMVCSQCGRKKVSVVLYLPDVPGQGRF